MQKTHINITLDETLLKWIDMDRGQEPRSSFINKILSKIFDKNKALFDWDKEEKKAEEDIKKHRVHKFKNSQEAVKWLKS